MDLREERKLRRRQQILAAARRLLTERGSGGLTMRELARVARVGEVTPYNVFGSKAGVVEAMWEEAMVDVLTRSLSRSSGDPVEQMYAGAELLAESWIENAAVFRGLVRAAQESGADLRRFSEGPIEIMQEGLRLAVAAKLLKPDVPLDVVARHIFLANQGALEAWSAGDGDDALLSRDLIYGLSIALLGIARPATRTRILARVEACAALPGREAKSARKKERRAQKGVASQQK